MNIKEQFLNDKTFQNNSIFTLGLLVLLIYSSFVFGPYVYLIALAAVLSSVLVEYLFHKTRKLPFKSSVLITPLILTLMVPPTLPIWMAIVGSVFGTFFAKSLFGGEGRYIFHPAVVGILFLIITFPAHMNTSWLNPVTDAIQTFRTVDSAQYSPFPTALYDFGDLLLGFTPGSTGETFRLGILLIGVAFMILKIIDYKIVVSYLGFFIVFTLLFNLFSGPRDVLYSVFTGTVVFASIFVIPDPTTAPKHQWARVLYGTGLALLTVIIRVYAAFPEGVIFAIIIMNAVSPLLDSLFVKEVTS
jgi:Na+-transporting NADH:ubiquinone oxidoreductase subunit B/electron transport complex protein RnfD